MNSQTNFVNKGKIKNRITIFTILGLILLSGPILISMVNLGIVWDTARVIMLALTSIGALFLFFGFINARIYANKIKDKVSLTILRATLVVLIFIMSVLNLFTLGLNYALLLKYYYHTNVFALLEILTIVVSFLAVIIFLGSAGNDTPYFANSESEIKKKRIVKGASSGFVVGFAFLIVIIIKFATSMDKMNFYYDHASRNGYINGSNITISFLSIFGAMWFSLYIHSLISASSIASKIDHNNSFNQSGLGNLKASAIFNVFGIPFYMAAKQWGKTTSFSNNSITHMDEIPEMMSSINDLNHENSGYRKYTDDDGANVEEKVERYDTGNGTKVVKTVRKSSNTTNTISKSSSTTNSNPSFDLKDFGIDGDFAEQINKQLSDFGSDFNSSFNHESENEYDAEDRLKEKIKKLRDLKDERIITEEEFKEQQRILVSKYTESL
ncbi:SHOCT domain-containing protein [Mycoplasma todarodis]|uniref:SHOCT domain-containing protein n=1 Tax=Mycoplasma todarodis TaxID=1937191 RepID=A0A4R0XV30_9MOLU|nr:SHOCT domain-containing protein [Mycoplasma todarodis]TCG11569.1 hypothetical protein C4B25_01145 [Mycoplasma todarodis]